MSSICLPIHDVAPTPTLDDAFQVVHISSLAAVLAKLNVKIPIEDLIEAIHDEDEAKRVRMTTADATQRCAAPSERKSMPPALDLTMNPANASSRSPTNRGNCRPRIYHRLRVGPQPS